MIFHSISNNCKLNLDCINYIKQISSKYTKLNINYQKIDQKTVFKGHTNSIKNEISFELFLFNKKCFQICDFLQENKKSGYGLYFSPVKDITAKKTSLTYQYTVYTEYYEKENSPTFVDQKITVGLGNF